MRWYPFKQTKVKRGVKPLLGECAYDLTLRIWKRLSLSMPQAATCNILAAAANLLIETLVYQEILRNANRAVAEASFASSPAPKADTLNANLSVEPL